MAWNGYFEYDGNEVINASRTEAYAKNAGAYWFRPTFKNDSLGYMLGDGLHYKTPLHDDAPWVDPDIPASLDFYGLYPLDVTGIEDSTRQSTVIESLIDGGTPGRIRHATKAIVFNGILIAGTEAGAEYGMQWLKRALLGNACGTDVTSACNGADLCYLSSEPEMELPDDSENKRAMAVLSGGYFTREGTPISVDDPVIDGGTPTALPNDQFSGGSASVTGSYVIDYTYPFDSMSPSIQTLNPEDCLTPYLRSLRRVIFNSGPSVTSKRQTQDGGAVWTVQFSGVAGSPWQYGAEVPIIEGFLDPAIDYPWAAGIDPADAVIDLDGYIHDETACVTVEPSAIYDPLFPALIPPPAPPSIPLGNYVPPLNWLRRQFTIPKAYVPLWGEVVPKVGIHAREGDMRNLRLRFYADPFGDNSIEDDPCAYCGDIVVSYVPFDHTLVLDGSEQSVYVITPGGVRRRADSLVFKTDGTPFDWPTLSCGFGYIVTLDLPQTQTPPVIDLSLYPRAT